MNRHHLVTILCAALAGAALLQTVALGDTVIDEFDDGAFSTSGFVTVACTAVGGERSVNVNDGGIMPIPTVADLVDGEGHLDVAIGNDPGNYGIKYGDEFANPLALDLTGSDRFRVELSQASPTILAVIVQSGPGFPFGDSGFSDIEITGPGVYDFLFSDPQFGSIDFTDITSIEVNISAGPADLIPPFSNYRFESIRAVAPPANDDCANAIAIGEGVHPFDNTAATTGIDPISDALCTGTFLGDFNQDIWFEYVATVTSDVEIATCGSGFDTDLGVYQGTCGGLMSVACNGDACDTSVATPFASSLELSVVAGESYLIRIGGWDGTESGAGDLLIAPLAPPGTSFVRGDCNADGNVDIGDAITALDVLFSGGTTPCTDACNVNGDSGFDIADAISVLSFLFSAGPAPGAPFPNCGVLDQLGCDSFAPCP